MHHKRTLYFIYVFIFFEMWFCSSRLLTVTVFCRVVIKGAAVYMITEWLLFRIEFRSRVKFALPSHDKTEGLSQGVIARVVFAPHQILMRHSPQTTRFGDFSLHDTRMKFRTRSRVSFRMKTGMNSFQNDLYGNELSFRYFVNKYRGKKEMEWTNSRMKVIPVSCEQPLSLRLSTHVRERVLRRR